MKNKVFTILTSCVIAIHSFLLAEDILYLDKQWAEDKAEILEYSLTKVYLSKELRTSAYVITEGFYYAADGKSVKKQRKNYLPILKSSIFYSLKRTDYPRHAISTLKVYRQAKLPILSEKVQIISWDGQICRKLSEQLIEQVHKTVFEVESWIEGNLKLTFKERPIWTVEQLFLRLRNLDFDSFSSKQIGLMSSLLEDRTDSKVYFAEVKLHPEIVILKDHKTRYVTITREDNKVFEFWLRQDGLHQIVLAKFPDGTTFKLKKIEWEKYRFF